MEKNSQTKPVKTIGAGTVILFFIIIYIVYQIFKPSPPKDNTNYLNMADTTMHSKPYVRDTIEEARIAKEEEKDNLKFEKSKAGKIQKKHPDWSKDDCEKVAADRVWIGMSLDMLRYERGRPNTVNPSNYGDGVQYQWCWDNYTPSCFYGGEDGIITSYN